MPTNIAIPRSIYTQAILIDTSALYALADKKDQYHIEASSCLQSIAQKHYPVWVTNCTIIETHRRILQGLGIGKGVVFLDYIYSSGISVVRAQVEDEDQAKDYIHRYKDQDLTYYDAISFAVMKRMGIGSAFTFDRHFTILGFNKIPPLFF
jgi:predicted nucleic acid-binding protein